MNNIENLFFWETIAALAFFSALVLGIGFSTRLILKTVKGFFNQGRRHKSIINTVNSVGGDSGLRGEVISRFVEIGENSEFGVRSGFHTLLVDYVMEQLRLKFAIKSLSQMCSINSKYCNQIMQLTDDLGNVFLLGLSWSDRTVFDAKGRLQHTCNQTITDFSFTGEQGEDRVIISNMTELAFPIALTEDHPSVVTILNILKEGEINSVTYNDKLPNTVKVFKLRYNRTFGYSLTEEKQVTTILSNRIMDLSYSDVEYDFGGKTHTMTMSKAIPVLVESLKLGENGLIFGPPGVGKSTLLDQLQARMANSEDIRVIIMTPAQIRELQNSEAKTAFEAALSGGTVKNIIFIDEGETLLEKSANGLHTDDNSIVLQMMSGGLQKALNCQLIIAFNALPENLNKALFRKGRAGMVINLTSLPAEKANQLLQEIKKLYPERIFDKEEYRKLLNMTNMAVDKTAYAKAGYITLADLYSAFPHKSKHAAIVRALSNATGTVVETPKAERKAEDIVTTNREGRPPRMKGVSLPVNSSVEQPVMKASVSNIGNKWRGDKKRR